MCVREAGVGLRDGGVMRVGNASFYCSDEVLFNYSIST